jgi:hypothetical protein
VHVRRSLAAKERELVLLPEIKAKFEWVGLFIDIEITCIDYCTERQVAPAKDRLLDCPPESYVVEQLFHW